MRGKRNSSSESTEVLLPPCRVCGAPGSGFHYGVTTCEACKGFFRRSFIRDSPYQCIKSRHCIIGPSTSRRQSCPKCRYNKCLAVGMSKDAIKTGRYSLDKKCQDILELVEHKESNGLEVNTLKEKAEAAVDKFNKYKNKKRKCIENKDPATDHIPAKRPVLNEFFPQWPPTAHIDNLASNFDKDNSQNFHDFRTVGSVYSTVTDGSSPEHRIAERRPVSFGLNIAPEHFLSHSDISYSSSHNHVTSYPDHSDYKYNGIHQTEYSPDHFMYRDQRRANSATSLPTENSPPNAPKANFTMETFNGTLINCCGVHQPDFYTSGLNPRSSYIPMACDNFEDGSSNSRSPTTSTHSVYNKHYLSDSQNHCPLPVYKSFDLTPYPESAHVRGANRIENTSGHTVQKYVEDMSVTGQNQCIMNAEDLNPEGVIARSFLGNQWEEICTAHETSSIDNCDLSFKALSNETTTLLNSPNKTASETSSPSFFESTTLQNMDNQDKKYKKRKDFTSICLMKISSLEKELEGMTPEDKLRRIKNYLNECENDGMKNSSMFLLVLNVPELSHFQFSAYQSYPFLSYVSEIVSPLFHNVTDITSVIRNDKFQLKRKPNECNCTVCVLPKDKFSTLEKVISSSPGVCLAPWKRPAVVEALTDTDLGPEVAKFIEAHDKLIDREDIEMNEEEIDLAQKMYLDLVQLKKRVYGANKFVPWEVYSNLLETKGIFADDRQRLLALYAKRSNETLPIIIRCHRYIPGFATLSTRDQMQLARDGFLKWHLFGSYRGYNTCFGIWLDTLNKWVLDINELTDAFPFFMDCFKSFKQIIGFLKRLRPTPEETVMMKAIAIMTPGNGTLENRERVEEITNKLRLCLWVMVEKKYDDPHHIYACMSDILEKVNQTSKVFHAQFDGVRNIFNLVLKPFQCNLFKEVLLYNWK